MSRSRKVGSLALAIMLFVSFIGVVAYACHPIITLNGCDGFSVTNSDPGTYTLSIKVDGTMLSGFPKSQAAPFNLTYTWSGLGLDRCATHTIVAIWSSQTDKTYNGSSCPCCTDTIPPTITCPPTVMVSNDPGKCFASGVSLGTPVTSDNCGVASVTNDAPSSFPVRTTTVKWTVTDIHGNTATCNQQVIVNDDENPTIICPAAVTISRCDVDNIQLGTPTTSDNCGVALTTNNAPENFPLGTTVVTWTVTDIHGNQSTCNQNVTVLDSNPPTIVCPPEITVDNTNGECGAHNVQLGSATASADCGSVTITNDAPAFFPVGTTIVTWKATDIYNKSATCSQQVTVVDNENPTIACPVSVTLNFGESTNPANTGWAIATDNCGIDKIEYTDEENGTDCQRVITRTWKATDIHGNCAICSQIITMVDNQAPILQCPSNVKLDCGSAINPDITGWPTVSDNHDLHPQVTYVDSVVPISTILTQINRAWKAIDNCGNASLTCVQKITIECSFPDFKDSGRVWPFDCCDCLSTVDQWPKEWPPKNPLRLYEIGPNLNGWDISYPKETTCGLIYRFGDALYYTFKKDAIDFAKISYIYDEVKIGVSFGAHSDTILARVLALRYGEREMLWAIGPETLTVGASEGKFEADILLNQALLGLSGVDLVLTISDTAVAKIVSASIIGLPSDCFEITKLEDNRLEFKLNDHPLWNKGLVEPFVFGQKSVKLVKVVLKPVKTGQALLTLSMPDRIGSKSTVYDFYHILVGWQVIDFAPTTLIVK